MPIVFSETLLDLSVSIFVASLDSFSIVVLYLIETDTLESPIELDFRVSYASLTEDKSYYLIVDLMSIFEFDIKLILQFMLDEQVFL